jgi:membrane protein YqaA with SNARE-associated domain
MKKALIAIIAVVLIVGMVGAVSANVFGGIVSWFFGAGTGEWITKKATFGQCCVENLWSWIPVFGWLVWIGSIIDNFKNVEDPQINWLFGTKSLAK